MKITQLLKCECGKTDFKKLKKRIKCKNCKKTYYLKNGIYDFLKTNSIIKKELEENKELQKQRAGKNDGWVLNLPLSEDFGNTRFLAVNQGYLANVKWILEKINLKGKRILDLGAGTCWTTNLLAKKGAKCCALDISSEKFIGLETAEVYFKHNKLFFERVLSDMESLPFNDASFDYVFVNAALHHTSNLHETMKEINRVLKPGGRLIALNEPCSSIFCLNKKINSKKSKKRGMDIKLSWNEQIYSLREYYSGLKKTGFKPKFKIPPSVDITLNNIKTVQSYKKHLGQILKLSWKIPAAKKLYWAGAFIFGAPIIIIGKK